MGRVMGPTVWGNSNPSITSLHDSPCDILTNLGSKNSVIAYNFPIQFHTQ